MSIYRLSKESHVPYSTLNDLVNHKLTVENMRSGQLKAIADALMLDMDTLYNLCHVNKTITSKQYNIQADITIEHKNYYINFTIDKKLCKHLLMPVKQDATAYLDIFAEWRLDEIIDDLKMEAAYEAIHS